MVLWTASSRKASVVVRRTVPLAVLLVCFCAEIGYGNLVKSLNATTRPNGEALLQCVPERTDEKVLWFRKSGGQVEAKKDKFVIDDENDTLTIYRVGENDVGEYVCQVDEMNFTVEVFCEPFVRHFDKSKNLIQGDTLELTCHTWGWPVPSVTWFTDKGGTPVLVDDRTSFERDGAIENATVKVRDVTLDDYMEYTCVASNWVGSVNATILVRVKDKLAPLWPFLGIVAEVIILVIIIVIYEKRRAKQAAAEARKDEAECL